MQKASEDGQGPSLKRSVSEELEDMWDTMIKMEDAESFGQLMKEYCVKVIGSGDDELFMRYFGANIVFLLRRSS